VTIRARRVELAEIQSLRALFLQEANVQWVHNSFHERGWSEAYLVTLDEVAIGYGARSKRDPRPLFEMYVLPGQRRLANRAFAELITVSGADCIEAQTNVPLLMQMLLENSREVAAQNVLFEDDIATDHPNPGVQLVPGAEAGEYALERDGEVVATGGFLRHYNPPFADLWMEVKEVHRRQGLGSYILQEVKRECYLAGRVPAARCNLANRASKATLLKAGMRVAGHIVTGKIGP
jgi:GNAT superfamily N-acetyltransferase